MAKYYKYKRRKKVTREELLKNYGISIVTFSHEIYFKIKLLVIKLRLGQRIKYGIFKRRKTFK